MAKSFGGAKRARFFVSTAILAFSIGVLPLPGSSAEAGAKGFQVLYYFCHQNNCASGSNPMGDLILDGKDNLLGTTSAGGAHYGGAIFELGRNGVERVLYPFCSEGICTDGNGPVAGLLADGAGDLFGTTQSGGQNNLGAVFEFSAAGTETVLHSFCSDCQDGNFPLAALVSDASGNLYGTASSGGTDDDGIVFKIAPDGTETIVHSFTRGSDGAFPSGRLLTDKNGDLYGTTKSGGSEDQGTIFKVTPDGTESVVYAFEGGTDASYLVAGLIADKKGSLYGTGQLGGKFGSGAVFKYARNGLETVIYSFAGGKDGSNPVDDLTMDKAGNLYGTTEFGGGDGCGGGGCGTVFSLSPKGAERVLHAFQGTKDGEYPEAGLVADKSGNLYGTARQGGAGGGGVVFEITP